MRKTSSIPVLLAAFLLAGCSETSFMNTLGIGKNAPNENLVSTNPPLSVPPDMQLRPPATGSSAPAATKTASAAGTLSNPPAYGSPPASPPTPDQAPAAAVQNAPAGKMTDASGRPVSSMDKIYIEHGIDVYTPDGKHKKIVDLNRELAEKIKAEKKARNPRYGTILNIGSIFSD